MPERDARRVWAVLLAGNYRDVQQRAVEADFIPARRVQFYGDKTVRLDEDLMSIVKEVLGSAPRGFKALQLFVPVWPPEDLIKHPVLDLIEALNGEVNVAFSDAVFSLSAKEPVVFDTVTLDFDVKDGFTLDEARQLANALIDIARRELGIEPLLIYTGCKGIHIKYFLREALPIELLKPLKLGVYTALGLGNYGLEVDEKTLDAKHVFKPPLVINTKCGGLSVPINEVDVEAHMLDTALAKGLAKIGKVVAAKPAPPPPPKTAAQGVGGGDVVEGWRRFIEAWLAKGFQLYDCRHRFSCILGRYCVRAGLSLDECLELLRRLVADGDAPPYVNRLRYCYEAVDKAQYLPSVRAFVLGKRQGQDKETWYVCGDDVPELAEILRSMHRKEEADRGGQHG
ncbi:MAG: hypothetical protein L7H00_03150 [Vulcanisaeta sp.]|nr:hypothetical protein [Vulcanisaeta sp.]